MLLVIGIVIASISALTTIVGTFASASLSQEIQLTIRIVQARQKLNPPKLNTV
ncbi:MAG TPA: hypothetical protein VFS97_11145 [Nitrososphaeraceae archaeon]|nr:hypothetical protein [Nitrososphaeraceae archaeon]